MHFCGHFSCSGSQTPTPHGAHCMKCLSSTPSLRAELLCPAAEGLDSCFNSGKQTKQNKHKTNPQNKDKIENTTPPPTNITKVSRQRRDGGGLRSTSAGEGFSMATEGCQGGVLSAAERMLAGSSPWGYFSLKFCCKKVCCPSMQCVCVCRGVMYVCMCVCPLLLPPARQAPALLLLLLEGCSPEGQPFPSPVEHLCVPSCGLYLLVVCVRCCLEDKEERQM